MKAGALVVEDNVRTECREDIRGHQASSCGARSWTFLPSELLLLVPEQQESHAKFDSRKELMATNSAVFTAHLQNRYCSTKLTVNLI